MKDKTKHKYLVGFIGENQCVYGKDEDTPPHTMWANPMTIFQARRRFKKLRTNHPKAIYKLVRVKP